MQQVTDERILKAIRTMNNMFGKGEVLEVWFHVQSQQGIALCKLQYGHDLFKFGLMAGRVRMHGESRTVKWLIGE